MAYSTLKRLYAWLPSEKMLQAENSLLQAWTSFSTCFSWSNIARLWKRAHFGDAAATSCGCSYLVRRSACLSSFGYVLVFVHNILSHGWQELCQCRCCAPKLRCSLCGCALLGLLPHFHDGELYIRRLLIPTVCGLRPKGIGANQC